MATSHPQVHTNRRRKRSIRLTVAALLVVVAAVAVAVAIVGFGDSRSVLVLAAVLAVVLGGVATRVMYNELLDVRLEAARDRAQQAEEHRDAVIAQINEHAAYVEAMGVRVREHDGVVSELENELAAAHEKVAESVRKLAQESRRRKLAEETASVMADRAGEAEAKLSETMVRMAELDQQVDVLRAELSLWQTRPAQAEPIVRRA